MSKEIGAAYVRLALAIEQHQSGYIDTYFGPAEWKAEAVQAGKQPLAALAAQARELAAAISASTLETQRKQFLSKQATAMQMTLRLLAGESVPFISEVEQLYDLTPQRVPDEAFEQALRDMAQVLPGSDPITERLQARRKKFEINSELAQQLFVIARDETRRRTCALFALPDDEQIEIAVVKDKPWGAYNWYLGKHRSLVEMNSDAPFHVNGIVGLLTHEGYPGHHTEHAIKEYVLYEQQAQPEACVLLINAPECVVSEGIATMADEVIFGAGELQQWVRAELHPRAGIVDELSLDEVAQLGKASEALRFLSDNAALMLHVDGRSEDEVIAYLLRYSGRTEADAKRSIRFLKNPLYRSYTFTYSYGQTLLRQLFEKHDKIALFKRLLSEPLTPTDLREWLK